MIVHICCVRGCVSIKKQADLFILHYTPLNVPCIYVFVTTGCFDITVGVTEELLTASAVMLWDFFFFLFSRNSKKDPHLFALFYQPEFCICLSMPVQSKSSNLQPAPFLKAHLCKNWTGCSTYRMSLCPGWNTQKGNWKIINTAGHHDNLFSPASPALTLLFYNWDVNLLKLPTNRKSIWLDRRYSQSVHPPFLHRGICFTHRPLHHITKHTALCFNRCLPTAEYMSTENSSDPL